jgi:hypothetical protein
VVLCVAGFRERIDLTILVTDVLRSLAFPLPPGPSSEYSFVPLVAQRVTGRTGSNIRPMIGSAHIDTSEVCFSCLCPHAGFLFGFVWPDFLTISEVSNPLNLRHEFQGLGIPSRQKCDPNSSFHEFASQKYLCSSLRKPSFRPFRFKSVEWQHFIKREALRPWPPVICETQICCLPFYRLALPRNK